MNVEQSHLLIVNAHNFGQVGCGQVVPFSRHSTNTVAIRRTHHANSHPIAFVASGDSLAGRGIFDGDILICRTQFAASESIGRICIVKCHGDYLAKIVVVNDDQTITLKSANARFRDRVYEPDAVEIVAIVESIQRRV